MNQRYQNLAYSGRKVWLEWNDLVKTIPKEDLPAGLKNEDQLFYPCGFMRLCDTDKLSAYDIDCLNALESAGLRDFQHVIVSTLLRQGYVLSSHSRKTQRIGKDWLSLTRRNPGPTG